MNRGDDIVTVDSFLATVAAITKVVPLDVFITYIQPNLDLPFVVIRRWGPNDGLRRLRRYGVDGDGMVRALPRHNMSSREPRTRVLLRLARVSDRGRGVPNRMRVGHTVWVQVSSARRGLAYERQRFPRQVRDAMQRRYSSRFQRYGRK